LKMSNSSHPSSQPPQVLGDSYVLSGANAMTAIYNASAVKIYNATNSVGSAF
jgi:hypothetical protein